VQQCVMGDVLTTEGEMQCAAVCYGGCFDDRR